jgi:nucleoid DNA-binding protein
VEISQYIRDLLFTHDRVILSDFGAFTAKYRAAKIDEKTNTMTPPGKEIVFDPTITKDGGLLRDYMVEQEGISAEDAEKQIMEYVKTIKSKLNAGKKVAFTELGNFVKLKDDKILFTYTPSENLLTDSFGLSNVNIPEDSGQKFTMPETVKPEKKPKENKSKKQYRGTLIFIIIIAAIVLAGVAIYFLKPQWVNSGKEYVTELFEGNAEPGDETKKDTDTTVVKKDEDSNKSETDSDKTDEDNSTVVPESTDGAGDTDKNKTSETDNSSQTSDYGDVAMKSPKRGYSYLIVASLPSPQAANEEKNRLKAKGINADIIPAGNNKYRLSVGEFTSFQEATRYYDEFHSKYKLETWLWEY